MRDTTWRHCRELEFHPAIPVPGSEVPRVRATGRPGAVCATCGEALTTAAVVRAAPSEATNRDLSSPKRRSEMKHDAYVFQLGRRYGWHCPCGAGHEEPLDRRMDADDEASDHHDAVRVAPSEATA